MNVDARLTAESCIAVTLNGTTREFPAFETRSGFEANYVFASPIVRGGKDWPVDVIVSHEGKVSLFYPSGLSTTRLGPIRISGFWSDSSNKSRHNKV